MIVLTDFDFRSYEFLCSIIISHGHDLPVPVNRSTLWRWRKSGHVPPAFYLSVYYKAVLLCLSDDDSINSFIFDIEQQLNSDYYTVNNTDYPPAHELVR